ncbi:MAG: hypothetical protein ACI8UO_001788 [Verrucomicrobiales bacterium]|jgi:hypothetical protein
MTDEEKNQFDALESLRAANWQKYESRMAIEWKICISLWTAMAALVVGIATGRLIIDSFQFAALVGAIPIASIILHFDYIRGVQRANGLDRAQSFYYENEHMTKLLGIELPEKVEGERRRLNPSRSILRIYSARFQLAITGILAAVSIAIIYVGLVSKPGSPNPNPDLPEEVGRPISLGFTGK